MPLEKLAHKSLERLIVDNLSTNEWDDTFELIEKLRSAKKRGWLTKGELMEIGYWKSPRAIKHIGSNHRRAIQKITQIVFKSRGEQIKIAQLTKLKGISLPMASSVLTLTNPRRYGVIDIRVWQVLFHTGAVQTNPKGVKFNFNEWCRYLVILRHFAQQLHVTARDIERTLFLVHKKHQDGVLYSDVKRSNRIASHQILS